MPCPYNRTIREASRRFRSYGGQGIQIATTRHVNVLRGAAGVPVWQRGFYEHVIRNEAELAAIREYIVGNPARWNEDENNPHQRLA